ncbi:MAG: hypothetical protein AAGJ87_10140 [Pseudomonadota bacterium]
MKKSRLPAMRRLACAGVVIIVGGTGAAMTAHAAGKVEEPKYITSENIKRSNGGYRVYVPGRGSFTILDVEATYSDSDNCRIHEQSLVDILAQSDFRPPQPYQAVKYRKIKMKAEQSGNEVNCSGSGSGCNVFIPVWDPDDPVLPE